MRMKHVFILGLAVTFLSWASGIVSGADTIKIGLPTPVSFDTGQGEIKGAEWAVEVINEAGGINGKKVELFVEDTQMKPEKAINAVKKLVLVKKVNGLVGVYGSGVVLSLVDLLSRFKIPLIATGSASDRLALKVKENYKKYKYLFHLMVDETGSAESTVGLITEYLQPKWNIKKIAIMVEDLKWTTFMSEIITKGVQKAGITVTEYIRFPIKETDFAAIFSRVKRSDADFLVQICSVVDGATYLSQWHDMQGPPIGGCDTLSCTDEFWEKTNGKCLTEMVFMYGAYPVDLTPQTRDFWNGYIDRYGIDPKYCSAFTYDAVMILAEAIRKAGTKGDDLVNAIENISYPGVSGLIEFDKKDHHVLYGEGRPTQIYFQWQGEGKRVPIYPRKYAEADVILPKWYKPKN